MTRLSSWLDELGRATATAEKAEQDYRADFARRVAALAEERAIAYRRVNLVRALAEAIVGVEDEEAAVAHGLAVLRTRLGWSSDSEARAEILERFAPVCAAAFGALTQRPHAEVVGEAEPRSTRDDGASFEPPLRGAPLEEEGGITGADHPDPEPLDPAASLAAFESWYLSARGTQFWLLFENVMPETPLVDF